MLLSLTEDEAEPAIALTLHAAGGRQRLSPTAYDFLDLIAAAQPGKPELSAVAEGPPDPETGRRLRHQARQQILRTAIALAVLNEAPTEADHARLARTARQLEVAEPAVDVIAAMAAGEVPLTLVRTVEFDAYRTPVPRDLALLPAYARYLSLGLPAAAIHGAAPDDRLAALFDGLAALPVGATGRAFADFYAAHGWRTPGRPGAVALPLTLHDWLHVYIGSTTEPLGEVEVGAYAAGVTRHHLGFHNLLIVLLMFEHGMIGAMSGGPGLAPAGAGARRALDRERGRGVTGTPDGGRAVADAILRGRATNTDLYLGVDHLAQAATPLADLRRRYEIPPRLLG
ncbi:hypothetical protein [Pilimelia columellifera]|uniref:Uncharacterized protein n=1 Tax=Pilimelia columellifera subsp. columellifera TaxID=706583 RepID=A0ABP6AZV1_9ACTN